MCSSHENLMGVTHGSPHLSMRPPANPMQRIALNDITNDGAAHLNPSMCSRPNRPTFGSAPLPMCPQPGYEPWDRGTTGARLSFGPPIFDGRGSPAMYEANFPDLVNRDNSTLGNWSSKQGEEQSMHKLPRPVGLQASPERVLSKCTFESIRRSTYTYVYST